MKPKTYTKTELSYARRIKQFEAEKRDLQYLDLPHREYERQVKLLAKKYRV